MEIKRPDIKYKKHKHYFTADRTFFDFNTDISEYEYFSYFKWRRTILFLTSLLFIASSILYFSILCEDFELLQNILSIFIGGLLSVFVWHFTTYKLDKLSYEIQKLDVMISSLDLYLKHYEKPYKFLFINDVESKDERLITINFNNITNPWHLLLLFMNECQDVSLHFITYSDDKFMLYYLPETHKISECSFDEYMRTTHCFISTFSKRTKEEQLSILSDHKFVDCIFRNRDTIVSGLESLRNKLVRRKMCIINGTNNYYLH